MKATQQIREFVDHTTGEILQSERIINKKMPTLPFTMLLHPTSHLLFKIKHVKDLHVLLALCEHAEFDRNRVHLTGSHRREIMELAGVNTSQLSACLARLKTIELISGGRGEATINAHVFWKGHTAARAKFLKQTSEPAPLTAESQFDAPAPKSI